MPYVLLDTMKSTFQKERKDKIMDLENYCKALEDQLNKLCKEIEVKNSRIAELEEIINNADSKLDDYYHQQKDNKYLSNDGKRLACRIIENCQSVIINEFDK